jgi:hypothetical protein
MRLNSAQKEPTTLALAFWARDVPAGASCPGHELRLRMARRDYTPEPQDDHREYGAVALEAGPRSAPRQGWRCSSVSARSHSPAGGSTLGGC